MASCSKAPRGLFVLLWVGRVLTANAVSPSPWSRHCPDRDAFRAGRNLPDKEFRYLRTVIVTAAVHRGFGSHREALPLTFRHWAGISPYTSSYDFSTDLWFCYPVAWAALLRLPARFTRMALHQQEHPFYQRYGVNLPSSLTRDHSSTLASSASLPVSVCGTGNHVLRQRLFVPVLVHTSCAGCCHPHLYSPLTPKGYQLERRSSRRTRSLPVPVGFIVRDWYRTIFRLSIGSGLRLRLRPD
jgi:hypothetical protein